jgi:hypothetical protein
MAQQVFTRQPVPQKGLWTAASPDAIGPEYSPWCENVRFRFGKVLRTPGRSVLLDTAPALSFVDFATLVDTSGYTNIMALWTGANNEIGVFDPAINKFALIGVLPGTLKEVRFSWTMGEEQLFVVRGSRVVAVNTQVASGVAPGLKAATPPASFNIIHLNAPSGCFLSYFKDHVFVGNILESTVSTDNAGAMSNRLIWSAPRNYQDWSLVHSDGTEAGGFLDLYDGIVEPITGMKVLNDRLVVYRNSTITDMNATGDALTPFLPENRVMGIGCMIPWSLVSVGQFHIFVGNDFNIYAWDGSNLDPIGSPIHSYLRQLFDPSMSGIRWQNMPFATAFMGFKEYWLVIPQGNQATVLIYDYFRGAWTRDVLETPITAMFEQILPGAVGTPGFHGEKYPTTYPTMMVGSGANFFEIDERIVGDFYTGGMDMFFDTPDMYYNQNAMINGTLERVLVSQDIPEDTTPYEVRVSIDRGNSFPYIQSVKPSGMHWGFEFADLNISSNVRRFRFFYPRENGATKPTLRAYTDVYVPSGEFFPVDRTLNPADPDVPPTNIN